MTLGFFVDGDCVGEVRCSQERLDLLEQNLHPSGRCGFSFSFPDKFRGQQCGQLSIHANGSTTALESHDIEDVLEVFEPDRPIFFMHIPKTAGTSFNNHIRQYFGMNRSRTHIEALDFKDQRSLAENLDYLAGHIPLEHIRNIYGDVSGVDLHTVVRDPISQLRSHLGWIKGIAKNRNSDFYWKHESLVRDMGSAMFATDLSTPDSLKQIVRDLDGFQIDFFDNIQTRYFLDYRPDRVGPDDLKNALSNLGNFRLIGATEKYNRLVREFCSLYGLKHRDPAMTHNPSRVKPMFDASDPGVLEAVEPLIRFDRKLYQAITERGRVAEERPD